MTFFKLNLAKFLRTSLPPTEVIQLESFIKAGLVWETVSVFGISAMLNYYF